MLFNSYTFIFGFLPLVLVVFYTLGNRANHRGAVLWLVLASVFFYGWWNPQYVFLILASIVFNFHVGQTLNRKFDSHRRPLLVVGVCSNLALIGYYKYSRFFLIEANGLFGTNYCAEALLLPLAISFFTFQQIAYLVDCYKSKDKQYDFLHYCLFVTFFPQLIAGPIVHHKELLPQFCKSDFFTFCFSRIGIGLSVFILGLFKKVGIADGIALHATPYFDAAQQGVVLSFAEAWLGALAYTFQLYFDFSGYSDMAIGLSHMLGVRLPLNFDSPYKATSITEFWRRWHMTLSRFLRDHIYIPLGGNRNGTARRYLNLWAVMLLGGLWHGAGWTFVLWGGLHGLYLIVNHAWRSVCRNWLKLERKETFLRTWSSRFLTFASVVVAWVVFRSETFAGSASMLGSMFGFNGWLWSEPSQEATAGLAFVAFDDLFPNNIARGGMGGLKFSFFVLLIVWFLPNTQQFFSKFKVAEGPENRNYVPRLLDRKFRFSVSWAIAFAIMMVMSLAYTSRGGEFLYFDF